MPGLISDFSRLTTIPDMDETLFEVLIPTGGGGTATRSITARALLSNVIGVKDRRQYSASPGDTTFAVIYNTIDVYVDGSLVPEADYTATNGTSVVFNSGLSGNEVVILIGFSTVPTAELPQVLQDLKADVEAAQADLATIAQTKTDVEGIQTSINATASTVGTQATAVNDALALSLARLNHVIEWATSGDPVSVAAGGDGTTTKSVHTLHAEAVAAAALAETGRQYVEDNLTNTLFVVNPDNGDGTVTLGLGTTVDFAILTTPEGLEYYEIDIPD